MRKIDACALSAMIAGGALLGVYPCHSAEAMTRREAQAVTAAAAYRNAQIEMERQVQERYNHALSAYSGGNYQQCVAYLSYDRVRAKYQNKMDYNIAMGDSYYHLGNMDAAGAYLRRAEQMGGSSIPVVNIDLGMMYFKYDNYSSAAKYLSRSADSSLMTGEALWTLAQAYDKTGNQDMMAAVIQKLIARFPGYNQNAYYALGSYFNGLGQYDKALNTAMAGLRYFSGSGDLLYVAGHACYLDANYEGAIRYLLSAEKVLPADLDVLYDLGASYLSLEDLDKAADICDKMNQIAPKDARTADLTKAVQQKIMERQMRQQMEMDMINQTMQAQQEAADMASQSASSGMMTPPWMGA